MSPKLLGSVALAALVIAGPIDARQVENTASPAESRVLGVVLDENENPVEGARVLLGDGRSTETDANGRFSFFRVRPGAHEIAAVTSTCEVAAGGFDVQSGRDAMLQLILEAQPAPALNRRSSGSASRVMGAEALAEMGNRSALEALEEVAPNTFEVEGHRLALRTRRGTGTDDVIEPLLVLDGVRVSGLVANALRGIRARELARIEVHLGSAATWEFQHGGAPAVIEVQTRLQRSTDPRENPQMCLGGRTP